MRGHAALVADAVEQVAAMSPHDRPEQGRVGSMSHATDIRARTISPDTPVLFEDFDNVLHRCDAYRTRRGIVPSDPAAALFEFAQLLEELLRPYPSLRIVLSTSWVQVLGFTRARDRLPLQSLRDRVIGATYHTHDELAPVWSTVPRGRQVLRYVQRHGLQRWLAVDDVREGFEGYEARLVHCQPGVGLGDRDVQERFAVMLAAVFSSADLPNEVEHGWPLTRHPKSSRPNKLREEEITLNSNANAADRPRLHRSRECLHDGHVTENSSLTRMSCAFDALYLCCLEVASSRGVSAADAEHPSEKIIDLSASALGLAPVDVELVQRLREWCRYVGPLFPTPCSPERALSLAEDVYRRTAELLASTRSDR